MPRRVLVQHQAHHRPARPLAPVRSAPRRLGQEPASLKVGLGPGVAPAKAMTPDKMLVEMLGREASVALAVKPLDLLGLLVGNRPAGAAPDAGPTARPRPRPQTAGSTAETSSRSSPGAPPLQAGSNLQPPSGSSHRKASTSSVPAVAPSAASSPPKGTPCTGQITCYLDRSLNVLATLACKTG